MRGAQRGNRGAITQSGDVCDVGGWGDPRTRWTMEHLAKFLVDDLKVYRATERSTQHSPLAFGVETALWPAAAKKVGT